MQSGSSRNPAAVAVHATWELKDLSSAELEKGIPVARVVDIGWVLDEHTRVREIENLKWRFEVVSARMFSSRKSFIGEMSTFAAR